MSEQRCVGCKAEFTADRLNDGDSCRNCSAWLCPMCVARTGLCPNCHAIEGMTKNPDTMAVRITALERRVRDVAEGLLDLAEAHRFLKDRYWRHSHWDKVSPKEREAFIAAADAAPPEPEQES